MTRCLSPSGKPERAHTSRAPWVRAFLPMKSQRRHGRCEHPAIAKIATFTLRVRSESCIRFAMQSLLISATAYNLERLIDLRNLPHVLVRQGHA